MRLRPGVAIDLGTVNTLVHVSGRGIVLEEPSAIAIERDTGGVVAIGEAADALTGKEPQDINVIHPLRDGVIADLEASVAMLQGFLRKVRLRRGLLRGSAVVCVPSGATWVERRSLIAAVEAQRPRCWPAATWCAPGRCAWPATPWTRRSCTRSRPSLACSSGVTPPGA